MKHSQGSYMLRSALKHEVTAVRYSNFLGS